MLSVGILFYLYTRNGLLFILLPRICRLEPGKDESSVIKLNHIFITPLSSLAVMVAMLLPSSLLAVQKKKPVVVAPGPLLTRTTTRHEVRRFGYGGTVTIVGAPQGSITVEGWTRNEVEVTADVELNAASEEDLNRLATGNGFVCDDDSNHLSLLSTGTHDREFMKK